MLTVKLGKRHPDPVVETASLSSVEPTDVTYKLSIPPETINNGLLSALQLESITYASQAHEKLLPDGSRAGFLIGLLRPSDWQLRFFFFTSNIFQATELVLVKVVLSLELFSKII